MEPLTHNSGSTSGRWPDDPITTFKGYAESIFRSAMQNLVPATVAMTYWHPFSTIKVKLQEGQIKTYREAAYLARTNPAVLFRGLPATLGSVPALAFKGYANDQLVYQYRNHVKRELSTVEKLYAAALASFLEVLSRQWPNKSPQINN